ncbi:MULTISPECIES: glycosyltransferase family 9 protein [Nostocales]|uniref:ADP-heptose--LPS heptosyltransferase n=3 Tax=Nostocales TaxID=1161 RepID=A0A0C1N8P8_9CYAN|nr:glycosyltransferase family 9 protein [Tolypothrix bouteillei]KAF3885349.1 glycosyltransferase family 9 protein [Tolypothrix bouteillei VB521301]
MLQENRLSKHLPIAQIAIVRSLPGLGDLLCAVPAMRAIRFAFPQAKITLIGLVWAQNFVKRFSHYLDDFLEFPGYPGIPEVVPPVHKIPQFFANVQQQDFDLALQMHGSGIVSNSFTVLLGARMNAGFYQPGQYCPDPNYFLPYPTDQPEVWRHLCLMEYLGIPLQGDNLEFPLQQEDFSALQQIEATQALKKGDYVCIHPGASVPERRWSKELFAAIGDAIAARGFQVVLTGTPPETSLTQSIAGMMQTKPIDLAGHTSLGAMAALLSQAALLVCNDTGVSHLAAALQVKSVVIFSNSDPNRWAPLNRDRHRILIASSLSPTLHSPLPTLETVMAQVDELLPKGVLNATR